MHPLLRAGFPRESLPPLQCLVPLHPGATVKNSPANARDAGDSGSIPRWGRSPGEGNGSPLQYSCLETPVDGGAWRAAVSGVTKEADTTQRSTHTSPFYPRALCPPCALDSVLVSSSSFTEELPPTLPSVPNKTPTVGVPWAPARGRRLLLCISK